jgi:hypothetical protein
MVVEIIRLLLCFFSGLYFPPKHYGKNIFLMADLMVAMVATVVMCIFVDKKG